MKILEIPNQLLWSPPPEPCKNVVAKTVEEVAF